MEEKFTAVYIMVRQSELTPEDGGSYEGPLQKQREACLDYLSKVDGGETADRIEIYNSRSKLLTDVERDVVRRLVVYAIDRLGTGTEEIDGILYELHMRQVEILNVTGQSSAG